MEKLTTFLDRMRQTHILRALREAGTPDDAAALLGVSIATFYRHAKPETLAEWRQTNTGKMNKPDLSQF
jgi:transcriptional regulator of acetoin/glycerol metabolism